MAGALISQQNEFGPNPDAPMTARRRGVEARSQPPIRGRSRLRHHGMLLRRIPRSGWLLPTWATTSA